MPTNPVLAPSPHIHGLPDFPSISDDDFLPAFDIAMVDHLREVVIIATDQRPPTFANTIEALERAGYHIGSAYTAVKDPSTTKFVYRDRLWQGADLAGLGVASFGHINGVHLQNHDTWESYSAAVERGDLPLARGYRPNHDERMIREFVLQLKLGSIRPSYFAARYGADVLDRFRVPLASLVAEGLASIGDDRVAALGGGDQGVEGAAATVVGCAALRALLEPALEDADDHRELGVDPLL